MVFSECKPKIRRCKFKSNWSCQNICTADQKNKAIEFRIFLKILIGKAIYFFYRNSMNDPYDKFHYFISINVKAIKKFECRLASVYLFKLHQIKQISWLFLYSIEDLNDFFRFYSRFWQKISPFQHEYLYLVMYFTWYYFNRSQAILHHILKWVNTNNSKIFNYWTAYVCKQSKNDEISSKGMLKSC